MSLSVSNPTGSAFTMEERCHHCNGKLATEGRKVVCFMCRTLVAAGHPSQLDLDARWREHDAKEKARRANEEKASAGARPIMPQINPAEALQEHFAAFQRDQAKELDALKRRIATLEKRK